MIRFLRHISACFWITCVSCIPFLFVFLPFLNNFFKINPVILAIIIIIIIFFLTRYIINFLGEKKIYKFIKQAEAWTRKGFYKKTEANYLYALRIYDSFLICPLKNKKITKKLTGSIANFSLVYFKQNKVFDKVVTVFLYLSPEQEDIVSLWLKTISNVKHQDFIEYDLLILLAKIHFKNPKIAIPLARIRYYPTWGELGFSFMGRYINQDHAELSDGTILNNRDSALGWATNLSAKVKTDGYDDIRFALHYGIGLGRYIAYNAYSAGTVDADGNIKLQPTYGGNIGYRHWWNKKLRSTLSFSYTGTDNNREILNSSTNLDSINKEAYSSQINLLWIPLPNAIIGVEYVKAKRKVESNKEGDLDSAMLRMRYDF